MKKNLYLTMFVVIMSMGLSTAQAENPECRTNMSIWYEHYKVKNYDAAYEPWLMVYNTCPEFNKGTFTGGERILKHKIKNSSGADQDGYIQDLLKLYEDSNKYFPAKFPMPEVMSDKALVMDENKMASDQQVYDMLDAEFKKNPKGFKNPKALYLYFSALVNLYNAGSKDIQEVFDTYDAVVEQMDVINKGYTDNITKFLKKEEDGTITSKEKRNLKIYSKNSESLGKVSTSIDAKLGELADCNNLIPLYQKNFDSRKGDVKWVKSATSRMAGKECTDDPMFVKLVEVQADLEPSSDVYYYLGILKAKKGDNSGAIVDFNKAVELEGNPDRKSNILYKIATIVRRSSKSQARSYLRKAVAENPANGKAYLLEASLVASSANACGSTPFEKRAIYWYAANIADKAGRVDPSLSGKARKTAASYRAKAPDKTMIFNANMAGKTVTFSCWVGGSVKVPNL
ncbi:hypothetical protein [Croceivirga thetidis]|uniref:Tetratricopeptide repeat protein n=1 Tax=Croceivirga thetidis TaxID=2721623 RepID=A0ABX1GP21_9FLAO|nr:hypothetical protein [Croceivirga thetidis]NKI31681.1 hypothetical protein [Croceivirga thetidis]